MKTPFFTKDELILLQQEIDNGYVNVNKHPTADLYIYNYTNKTQYEPHWNDITIRCRGLILDGNGCLVAKGFDKFFTDDQLKNDGKEHLIPTDEPFKIYNKADGSLGVMYFIDSIPYIATRGSFVSDMACVANEWLRGKYKNISFNPKYTYLFEIIYPENRIIINYGDDRKLVLLAVIDNDTMKEYDIYSTEFDNIEEHGIERVEMFDGYSDWKKIMDTFQGDKSKEGFVVHFLKSNYRVKMKLDWYKDVARTMQHFTKKTVWRMLRDGKDVLDLIKTLDDEFYPNIRKYFDDLWDEHNEIIRQHILLYNEIIGHIKSTDSDFSNKNLAIISKDICKKKNSQFHLIMKIHKGHCVSEDVWKLIEPFGNENI